MTNIFDQFRSRVGCNMAATDKKATAFITEGSMATEISVGEKTYQVGLVYDNREDMDKTFLYIIKPDTFTAGTIFCWTDTNLVDHHYIIYDEEKQVKNTRYNKYLCFECNVEVEDEWGYLSGPRTKYINTQLRQLLYEVSLAQPVLIMGSDKYVIASILTIGDRNWRVIEKDNYSAPGLVYYSLEQYVAQKDSDFVPDDFIDDDVEPDTLRPGQEVQIETEEGFFQSTPAVKARVTPTMVTFNVPYDTDELTVVFKTGNEVVTRIYKVVM